MQSKGYYSLTVRQGPEPGHTHRLSRNVTTVGRDVRCDVVVSDAEVSRSHTRLTAQAGGFLVEDLGSTNGTYINGQRLTSPRRLQPGDRLGLGETVSLELEFVMESVPTVISADAPASPAQPEVPPTPFTPGDRGPVVPPAAPSTPPGSVPSPASSPAPSAGLGAGPGAGLAPAPARSGGWGRWAVLGCGCLLVVICLAALVALGVFLWTAPVEFWRDLYRFFGLY